MNFLAHLFLSYPHKEEMTGNFIGDFVKGRQLETYPPEIAIGIRLHRLIDEFTDKHARVREINQLFKPHFKRYSGVVSDIAFDHLLARHWNRYQGMSLDDFAIGCYDYLYEREAILPERVQYILPKLVAARRLQSYAYLDKTADAIELMAKFRTFYFDKSIFMQVMENENDLIEAQFFIFFDELVRFVSEKRNALTVR